MDSIDAVVLISFGGPEQPEDVMPFLRNVTRGRDVPEDRLRIVAEQYELFGGRSPINDQNRALLAAIEAELHRRDITLPVFWGNRNWDPYLADTVTSMADQGLRRAVGIVTSAYSSYSSCRQYKEDIERTTRNSPVVIEKIGQYFDADGFVQPFVDGLRSAYEAAIRATASADVAVLFTAHSIPESHARNCRYEDQLRRTAARIADEAAIECRWDLVFQSRSGSPHVPWLVPDINDHLRELAGAGVRSVIVVPIGFVSDHQEVIFDLDYTAKHTADALAIEYRRVATPGTDSRFVAMLVDRVEQHITGISTLRCLGDECCLAPPPQRPRAVTAGT